MKEVRKKNIVIAILCGLLCIGVAAAIAFSQLTSKESDRDEISAGDGYEEFSEGEDYEIIEGERKSYEIGKKIEKSVHELLKLDKANTAIIRNDPSMDDSEIMGEVMGIKISKTYFNFRYDSHKSNPDCEDLTQEAWESVIKQIWKQKFAEENNLMPTKKEIKQYNKETRKDCESSQEGKIFIKAHCKGINLTEDEYWEFHRRYYAPLAVIHGKVTAYMEENNMTMPDISEIEAKVIDTKYFEQLS